MSGGWNTIESDAGVFTYLIERLGVKDVQFEELISLDPAALQQLSPVYGVIFLFKYPTNEPQTTSSIPQDGTFDHSASATLFFAAQVIQNACGTQALLSVLLNKDTSSSTPLSPDPPIDIGPRLRDFKDFTQAFPAELRGEALSNSELIRDVHNSFARSSPFVDETLRRSVGDDDDDVYHFIAYTSVNNTLYELDGLQPAPISHGDCPSDEFAEKVIPVLQRRIQRYPAQEIRFNLLAMTRDLRIRAREVGDWEGVEREEGKRREWVWENALRRHNFLGFAGEVLKEVTRIKVRNGSYDKWIEDAKEETRRKVKERKKKGVEGEETAVNM